MVRFAKGDRKIEVMGPYLDRLARAGRTGVAAIGVAQEFQRVFTGTTYHQDEGGGGVPHFSYAKADRRVTAYYFYLVDEMFGAAFVKVCAYGSAATDDPAGLQQLCDTLRPGVTRCSASAGGLGCRCR